MRIESTHHGPIVAHKDGKAYSLAIPYANEYRLMDTGWDMATAHNLAEAKKALAGLQFMAQNIMIGTVDGDIYYVRNGRVPMRPEGLRPVEADAGGERANANGRGCIRSKTWCRSPIRRRVTCRTATSRRSP